MKEELDIPVEVLEPVLICDSIDPAGSRHILNICFRCRRLPGEMRLGNDRRLFDYSFLTAEELRNSMIYPPIGNEILKIMEGAGIDLYAGRIWL